MNARALLRLAASLLALCAGAADANTLRLFVVSNAGLESAADAKVTSSPKYPLQIAAPGSSIDLTDTSAVFIPIDFTPADKDGFTGYARHFDMPYYEGRSAGFPVGAALVNDDQTQLGIDQFLAEAHNSNDFAASLLLNARAEHIWKLRQKDLQDPKPDVNDAKVVFWLLQSTANLITMSNMQVDGLTQKARDWMVSEMQSPSELRRLFGRLGPSQTDTRAAIAIIDQRQSIFYARVLNQLDRDATLQPFQTDACARVKALVTFYDGLPVTRAYPGADAHRIKALNIQTRCTYRALNDQRDANGVLTAEAIADGNALADQVNAAATAGDALKGDKSVQKALAAAENLRTLVNARSSQPVTRGDF